MTTAPDREIAALIAESLTVWRLDGEVAIEGDALVVTANGGTLRIAPAPQGLPFRWMVSTAQKSRGAGSIATLLRAVRQALDPDHAGSRLRLAPQGVLPP